MVSGYLAQVALTCPAIRPKGYALARCPWPEERLLPESTSPDKRTFLQYSLLILAAAVALMGAWGLGRFAVFGTRTKKNREISKEVLAGIRPDLPYHHPEAGAWIVKADGHEGFTAFDDRCPHLGCRQNWNPETRLFECPCHGSQFDSEGNVKRGPATRPMQRLFVSTEDSDRIRLSEKPSGG